MSWQRNLRLNVCVSFPPFYPPCLSSVFSLSSPSLLTSLPHISSKLCFAFNPSAQGPTAAPIKIHILRALLARSIEDQKVFVTSHSRGSMELEGKVLQNILQRLSSGAKSVMVYEEKTQQRVARKVIDFCKIRLYGQEYRERHPDQHEDIAFLQALLRWFKGEFFTWCNKPPCLNPQCPTNIKRPAAEGPPPAQNLKGKGVCEPNAIEKSAGWAGRTELYECNHCKQTVRFPRYNNPMKLLNTRTGRCGEWANAFCMICRALSLDARWVLDFTDHVWVEIWVPSLQRYVHVDPCERAFDAPLMYESGWKKQLSYVFSFSRHGVVDATSKYTRQLGCILERRGPPIEKVGKILTCLFSRSIP